MYVLLVLKIPFILLMLLLLFSSHQHLIECEDKLCRLSLCLYIYIYISIHLSLFLFLSFYLLISVVINFVTIVHWFSRLLNNYLCVKSSVVSNSVPYSILSIISDSMITGISEGMPWIFPMDFPGYFPRHFLRDFHSYNENLFLCARHIPQSRAEQRRDTMDADVSHFCPQTMYVITKKLTPFIVYILIVLPLLSTNN